MSDCPLPKIHQDIAVFGIIMTNRQIWQHILPYMTSFLNPNSKILDNTASFKLAIKLHKDL
jgi:hypothetical protein